MEQDAELQRQIQEIRAKELGGGAEAGTSNGKTRASRYSTLPLGLQGARPVKTPRSVPTSSSSAFVSATSARLAERATWETRRAAREALLEAEREKAREEREIREAEELKQERARRIPKANPIPEDIYGSRVVQVKSRNGAVASSSTKARR